MSQPRSCTARLGGIAGAKLFMFLFDWPYYLQNPGEIFTLSTLQAAGVFSSSFIVALVVAVCICVALSLSTRDSELLRSGRCASAIGRSAVSLPAVAGDENAASWACVFIQMKPHRCRLMCPCTLPNCTRARQISSFLPSCTGGSTQATFSDGTWCCIRELRGLLLNFSAIMSNRLSRDFVTQWIALGLLGLGSAILIRVRQTALAPRRWSGLPAGTVGMSPMIPHCKPVVAPVAAGNHVPCFVRGTPAPRYQFFRGLVVRPAPGCHQLSHVWPIVSRAGARDDAPHTRSKADTPHSRLFHHRPSPPGTGISPSPPHLWAGERQGSALETTNQVCRWTGKTRLYPFSRRGNKQGTGISPLPPHCWMMYPPDCCSSTNGRVDTQQIPFSSPS